MTGRIIFALLVIIGAAVTKDAITILIGIAVACYIVFHK
jgi:hypothetical protein